MKENKLIDLNAKVKSLKISSQERSDEDVEMYVGFKIGDEEYGIDIMIIKEIIRKVDITIVPNSPEYVEGVANLRGEVIPLLDLRKKFNMKVKKRGKEARTIVVEIEGKSTGISVDKVTQVIKIPQNKINVPPQTATSIRKDFIKNVGRLPGRLILILDIVKIISS